MLWAMKDSNATRRRWLQAGAALALSPLAQAYARSAAQHEGAGRSAGYGPLRPVLDEATGLPLLELPVGFSYRSFAWAGMALADGGGKVPGSADGMGIVRVDGERFTLVRNHEIIGLAGSFGPADSHYDPPCSGGTVTLVYDRAAGQLESVRGSLSGTLNNCAGGITPWGSWLSCEELVTPAKFSDVYQGHPFYLERAHGFVFEVPADGSGSGQPLPALGQFRHEAAAVDPRDGTVYLTEDHRPAGFYRLLPSTPGKLSEGGRLQMLRAKGCADLRRGLRVGQRFEVDWVDIERPADGFVAEGKSGDGVLRQGRAAGGSLFTRLEGLEIGDDELFFTATDGGDARCGQVFRFIPSQQLLELFYESPSREQLDYPDNLCLGPRGLVVLCEDSKQPVQRLWGLDRAGGLFELARNHVRLAGQAAVHGHRGDFRGAEWAGACFSPDGKTLFANIYRPGLTVAISGPF
jgi:secreted PhoX family phosphatase